MVCKKINKALLLLLFVLGAVSCSCAGQVEGSERIEVVQSLPDGSLSGGPFVRLNSLGELFLEQLGMVQQLAAAAQLATPSLSNLCCAVQQGKKEVPLMLFYTALEEAQRYVRQSSAGYTFKNLTTTLARLYKELIGRFPALQHANARNGLLASVKNPIPTKPTSANIPNTLVSRDEKGGFSAEVITASLIGAASQNLLKTGDVMSGPLIMDRGNGVSFKNGYGTAGVTLAASPSQTVSYSLALPSAQGGKGQALLLSKTTPGQLEWGRGAVDDQLATEQSSLADPNTLVLRDGNGDFAAHTITADVRGAVRGDVVGNVVGNVTGQLTGDVVGNVVGNLTGVVYGSVIGNASENILRAGDTMTGPLRFAAQNSLTFVDALGKTVSVQAPDQVGTSYTLKLPQTQGSVGQVLAQTDSGQLGWTFLPATPQAWQAEVSLTPTSDTVLSANDASNQLYNLTPVLVPITNANGTYSYGFLANSAVTAFPQLVGRDAAGNAVSFDAKQLVPLLVNEVKQLQTSHEELWKAITVLQGQINMRGKQL